MLMNETKVGHFECDNCSKQIVLDKQLYLDILQNNKPYSMAIGSGYYLTSKGMVCTNCKNSKHRAKIKTERLISKAKNEATVKDPYYKGLTQPWKESPETAPIGHIGFLSFCREYQGGHQGTGKKK